MAERISASVIDRHIACPASANLELAIPNWIAPVEDRTADNAANRGTAKHEMLEPIMALPPRELQMMADAIQYVADLRKGRRFKVLIEQEFTATWLKSKPKTKADLVLYNQDEIHVLDWKWGKIPVDVWQNGQALYYGVCAAHLAPKAKGVNLHIVQPPAGPPQHWFADTNVMKEFIARAQEAEAKVLAGDTTFGPSDHCKFCVANPHSRGLKGRPLCPALMQIHYPSAPVDEAEILGL